MSNDIKKLLESIDTIAESRYRIRTKGANAYEVVINGGEHDGKVMLLTKDLAKAERALDNFEQGYKKSKAGREEEWSNREKEAAQKGDLDPQIKIESEDLDEQNDFPRQAMDYGTGMKPRAESDHAAKDRNNFESDPRWAEYDKLQSQHQFTQARELMNRMRYEHHMDESTEVDEGVKWNSFKRWYDESPKDVITRARKADTNFLKNVIEVDPRDLGGAAKLQWMAARKELSRRGIPVAESFIKENAERDGYDAFKKGTKKNPHLKDTKAYKDWYRGYTDSKHDHEDKEVMTKQKTNESMWEDTNVSDPVVVCMHKDGHKMYFKEFHANGNYYWTADKDDARDFESEDAASSAIKMIKAHDPAVYKMGLVGKTHGEKPYPIYCEPLHEVAENFAEPAGLSPLTHGIDNVMDEEKNDSLEDWPYYLYFEDHGVYELKSWEKPFKIHGIPRRSYTCAATGESVPVTKDEAKQFAISDERLRAIIDGDGEMDEDWSADEYNRQKMIDAPKSRQHNPVSEPGEHSFVPRSSKLHELDEVNDHDEGQDEIIQDLSGKLNGEWPLRNDNHGGNAEMEDSPMDADPDSVIDEFYTTMPSKGIEKMPVREGFEPGQKVKFVQDVKPNAFTLPKGVPAGTVGTVTDSTESGFYKVYVGNDKYAYVKPNAIVKMDAYDNEMHESVISEKSAPGQEAWIKANKGRFMKEYGKKKGLEVLYATAWKRSKKNESVSEGAPEFNWKVWNQGQDDYEKHGGNMENPYAGTTWAMEWQKGYDAAASEASVKQSPGRTLAKKAFGRDMVAAVSPGTPIKGNRDMQHFESMFAEAMESEITMTKKKINESFDLTDSESTKKIVDSLGSMMKNAGLQSQKAEYKLYVSEGTSVAVHKAYPGKVDAIKSDLQKYHSDNGGQIPSTEKGDYVHFHLPHAGHNSADAVKRTLRGHEGHPAYSPENVSEGINEGKSWTVGVEYGPTGNDCKTFTVKAKTAEEAKKKAATKAKESGLKNIMVNAPSLKEDLSATLTMSKCEDGKSMSLTITDQQGDEISQLLSLAGIQQPQTVAVVSAELEPTDGEAPEQHAAGYEGAYEMVDEDEEYSDRNQDPTGKYGDTHEYSNRPKKDVYDLDTQINKGSDLNAPKGEYAKEFPGDNRMDTAKRDAAFESKLWKEYKGIK